MEFNYCLVCGHPLETRDIGGTDRRACPNCSFVQWGNYSVGVGALMVKGGKVLLVRRAQEPGKGFWTNPGGYIEQEEPIEETVIREVFEETGIHSRVKSVVAVRDQPRSIHNIYIAFMVEYVDGNPTPDGFEVDDAGFFSVEEMQQMNVAGFTKWLVDIALNGKIPGLQKDEESRASLNNYGLFRISTDGRFPSY